MKHDRIGHRELVWESGVFVPISNDEDISTGMTEYISVVGGIDSICDSCMSRNVFAGVNVTDRASRAKEFNSKLRR